MRLTLSSNAPGSVWLGCVAGTPRAQVLRTTRATAATAAPWECMRKALPAPDGDEQFSRPQQAWRKAQATTSTPSAARGAGRVAKHTGSLAVTARGAGRA